jgi:hypothetical protein
MGGGERLPGSRGESVLLFNNSPTALPIDPYRMTRIDSLVITGSLKALTTVPIAIGKGLGGIMTL